MIREFFISLVGLIVVPPVYTYQILNPDTNGIVLDKDKSIFGTDRNSNLIRDDIENYINAEFKDPVLKSYLKHFYSNYTRAYSDLAKGNESKNKMMLISCIHDLKQDPSREKNEVDLALRLVGNSHHILFNTPTRKDFFKQHDSWRHPLYRTDTLPHELHCDPFKRFE